jgi:predicted GNAT family acetyltransferase
MQSELIHNETGHQFEFGIDGQTAFVEYFTEGKKIYLTHTEVPEAIQGQGIGTELVKQTLRYIKKHHWILVPQCAFVSAYVDNHPEWHSILSEGYQM